MVVKAGFYFKPNLDRQGYGNYKASSIEYTLVQFFQRAGWQNFKCACHALQVSKDVCSWHCLQ